MTAQGALFANTAQGNIPIEARLIVRATDPATSKAGAEQVARSDRVDTSLSEFLNILRSCGPKTCKEAAARLALIAGYSKDYWAVEFNKRVHRWHVAGEIEPTGEVRDGGRVWRIA